MVLKIVCTALMVLAGLLLLAGLISGEDNMGVVALCAAILFGSALVAWALLEPSRWPSGGA